MRFSTRNRFISFLLIISLMAFKLLLISLVRTNENMKQANASETTPTIYQYINHIVTLSAKKAKQKPTGFLESNGKLQVFKNKIYNTCYRSQWNGKFLIILMKWQLTKMEKVVRGRHCGQNFRHHFLIW